MQPLPSLSSETIRGWRPAVSRPEPGPSPLAVVTEMEAVDKLGHLTEVLTVFLRGSECSFQCLMCDLWKYTHPGATPAGAIPAQVVSALAHHPTPLPAWIKLYNASNFFSPANIPHNDLPAIAAAVSPFERVIVENHPRVINSAIVDFQRQLPGTLEVAMGLETIHEPTLRQLNKQLKLDDFKRACEWLGAREISIRCFVLLRPPGMSAQEGIEWCIRSVEYAHRLGVRHISIIPLRGGNGALERLQHEGLFEPPSAACLEQALAEVIDLPGAVITADLWDWDQLAGLTEGCRSRRRQRLENANRSQQLSAI